MSTGTIERTQGRRAGDDMDPRIAARRDLVTRDRAERKRRRIVTMSVVVIVLAAGWFVLQSPLFDVASVTVEGNLQATTDEIRAASGIREGEALISVRPGVVGARVRSVPWIDDAVVDVGWSGEVHITVTERIPVAIVMTNSGQTALADSTGRVLTVLDPAQVDQYTDELVRVEGVEITSSNDGQPSRITGPGSEDALLVAAELGQGVRTRVDAIVVTSGNLELRLRPSGTVLLGTSQDIESKMRSLTTVLAQVSLEDLATIDLRVPDQPVVTRTSNQAAPDMDRRDND